jgi:hypothetical protein
MTQKKRSLLGKLKRGCVYYPKTIDSGICHVKLGSVNRSFKRNFRRREKNVQFPELNTLQFYGTMLQ